MIWADLRILVLDTGRVWWRTLPQILSVYLLGWLGVAAGAQRFAIRAGEWNSWAALAIFSFGFLAQLVAIVVMLQIVGRELGVRDLIPEAEAVADDRDTSLTRLVSITLLPFLGIYAAFGEVGESATQLANEQLFRNGVLSDGPVGPRHPDRRRHRAPVVAARRSGRHLPAPPRCWICCTTAPGCGSSASWSR